MRPFSDSSASAINLGSMIRSRVTIPSVQLEATTACQQLLMHPAIIIDTVLSGYASQILSVHKLQLMFGCCDLFLLCPVTIQIPLCCHFIFFQCFFLNVCYQPKLTTVAVVVVSLFRGGPIQERLYPY
jgi:hypothetical protein